MQTRTALAATEPCQPKLAPMGRDVVEVLTDASSVAPSPVQFIVQEVSEGNVRSVGGTTSSRELVPRSRSYDGTVNHPALARPTSRVRR